MWMATNSGTFSAAYNDGSFSAQGSFSSSGNFGEMGTERNGSFATEKDSNVEAELHSLEQGGGQVSGTESMAPWSNSPLLKGRVPIEGFPLRTAPAASR
jgi:hypothetical protein